MGMGIGLGSAAQGGFRHRRYRGQCFATKTHGQHVLQVVAEPPEPLLLHAVDGGGLIGPNLTDDHWIHGGAIEQVHGIIVAGVLAKGMPAWGEILKPEDVEVSDGLGG